MDTDAQDFSGNSPFLDLKLITLCFVEGCGVVLFSFSFLLGKLLNGIPSITFIKTENSEMEFLKM